MMLNEMTPHEKAKQLYGKFYGVPLYIKTVKECCMITVNELIRVTKWGGDYDDDVIGVDSKEYWEQVKQEIEKL